MRTKKEYNREKKALIDAGWRVYGGNDRGEGFEKEGRKHISLVRGWKQNL